KPANPNQAGGVIEVRGDSHPTRDGRRARRRTIGKGKTTAVMSGAPVSVSSLPRLLEPHGLRECAVGSRPLPQDRISNQPSSRSMTSSDGSGGGDDSAILRGGRMRMMRVVIPRPRSQILANSRRTDSPDFPPPIDGGSI